MAATVDPPETPRPALALAPHLQPTQPASDDLQEEEPPTREEMLEAIPMTIEIADDVDLDAPDPSQLPTGSRRCIAVRKAGGRCTARPVTHSLLCSAHAGLLDASAGGKAKAEKHRRQRYDAEEQARMARLGTRGVIAHRFSQRATSVARTIDVLLDAAELGDVQAAKLVIPYLNQGLGMPTETVQVTQPQDAADLAAMGTADLAAYVAARRTARAAAEEEPPQGDTSAAAAAGQ